MAMLTKPQLARALNRIEASLTVWVPEVVEQFPCPGPAYAVLLCYFDLSTDEYTPVVIVVSQATREEYEDQIKEEHGEAAWAPHQRLDDATYVEIDLEDEELTRLCNSVYETLSDDWGDKDEEQIIMPFRKSMFKVAKALNKLDWSKILDVTDDFVVAAVDYSGFWVSDDVPKSIPAKKKKLLEKNGWLMDMSTLTPEVQDGVKAWMAAEKMKPAEQVQHLMPVLEKLHAGKPAGPLCDGKEDESMVVSTLHEAGKPSVRPVLEFVEARAGTPKYSKHTAAEWPMRLRLLLQGLRVHADKYAEVETLLQSIIRKSLKKAKSVEEVALLANIAAEHLGMWFKGYPEDVPDEDWELRSDISDFLR